MARISWKRSEIETIKANCDTKTTDELMELLPGRSRKAISRKIEKLRKDGTIGHRSKETIKRAYRQRTRGKKKTGGKAVVKAVHDDYEPLDDEDDE